MQEIKSRKKLKKAFANDNVAIALSSSDYYVPYLSVVLESLYEHSDKNRNYDIIILNKDISEKRMQVLSTQFIADNISIRFYDINEMLVGKNFYYGDVAVESYFRVFLPDVLECYEKVVFLDCDVIVNRDIANLYDIDIETSYLAAVRDFNIIGCYHAESHWKPYLDEILSLKTPYKYIQAGVLLINLKKMRDGIGVKEIVDVCTSYAWKLLDQDVLNYLFQGEIVLLDSRWNVMTGDEGREAHILNNTPVKLRKKYTQARKNPHIIHFCGKAKPWLTIECDYGAFFWKHARKTPFFEVILERKIKSEIENAKLKQISKTQNECDLPAVTKTQADIKEQIFLKKKVAVFRVLSVYQLLNAINLKLSILKNIEADLIVSSATNWGESIDNLKQLGIFRNTIISKDVPQDYFKWKTMNECEKEAIMRSPEKYLYILDLRMDYTDYYLAVSDPYNQLFFYYLVKQGLRPKIHFFEDGLSTYLIDYEKPKDNIWDHDLYSEYRFYDNIQELFLYESDLYVYQQSTKFQLKKLPKLKAENEDIRKTLTIVFGQNELPKEKFIFLEEPFAWDGITATDMELIEELASIVGKENIRVKLHPRSKIDRFTPRGFKIFESTTVPWEISIMQSDITRKILVTVSSTAATTAGFVFDASFNALNLFDLIAVGESVHVRSLNFKDFYYRMSTYFNSIKKQVMTPKSLEEFKEMIIFFEGRIANVSKE